MARMKIPGWSACEEFKEDITSIEDNYFTRSRIKPLTRATKNDIKQIKSNLKAELPVLTAIGIRRSRVPYHEIVLLELEENGMIDAAINLKRLFLLDKNKILTSQRDLVDYLQNKLIAVEISKRTEKYQDVVRILLNAVMFFKAMSSDWLWVAGELLKEALHNAETIKNDGGLMANAMKFIYGKFLFNNVKNLQEAVLYFEQVRLAAEGKRWNASRLLKINEKNLYRESNIFLYKIHLILAKELRNTDVNKAVDMSLYALERANESGYEEHVVKALHELGNSEMAAGNVTDALKNYAKFLAKAKRIPDAEAVCDALKELACAHEVLKDNDGTLKYLQLFQQSAVKYKLPAKLANAHFYTGKYLLQQKQSIDASFHLKMAFDIFKSLKMREEMDRSRFLLGISKGEEVMEEFMKLILKCGNNDDEATIKLLQWKNQRIPFWKYTTDNEQEKNEAATEKIFNKS